MLLLQPQTTFCFFSTDHVECASSCLFGATREYPSTIEFLKRHPLKNEACLFICKLVDGYSEVSQLFQSVTLVRSLWDTEIL